MPIFRENSTTGPKPVDGAIRTVSVSLASSSSQFGEKHVLTISSLSFDTKKNSILGRLLEAEYMRKDVWSRKGWVENCTRREDKILEIAAIKFRLGNSVAPAKTQWSKYEREKMISVNVFKVGTLWPYDHSNSPIIWCSRFLGFKIILLAPFCKSTFYHIQKGKTTLRGEKGLLIEATKWVYFGSGSAVSNLNIKSLYGIYFSHGFGPKGALLALFWVLPLEPS